MKTYQIQYTGKTQSKTAAYYPSQETPSYGTDQYYRKKDTNENNH